MLHLKVFTENVFCGLFLNQFSFKKISPFNTIKIETGNIQQVDTGVAG